MLTVYIGFDRREQIAYEVCRSSILRYASKPVNIQPLRIDKLEAQMLMVRRVVRQNGQMFDSISNAPQATEFACSRFLAPILHQEGWAIFMDCDMVLLDDIYKIPLDNNYPLLCVKHEHNPAEAIKMDGQAQIAYPRKNWSSFFAFNASHPSNERLNLAMVNGLPGRELHRFCWLFDEQIGELSSDWNWLVNAQPKPESPAVAHFTLGGAWFENWQPAEHDDIWHEAHAWHLRHL